ncbi:hypothetical protein [Deinococcus sp.]|uniref:hypothetical protein n=1 Tax=Deinococcus sp. TaxID=47478 RepID=UPI0025BA82EB|nr:hypothetical protein [Deinococcus sp.]
MSRKQFNWLMFAMIVVLLLQLVRAVGNGETRWAVLELLGIAAGAACVLWLSKIRNWPWE